MKRREFLKQGCLLSASAMLPLALDPLPARAQDLLAPKPPKNPVLVLIFLRGGVDQLSLLPPLEDDRYLALRSLTAERYTKLKLSGPFSLHSNAKDPMPLWNNKNLSFIVNTGLPAAVRSHSDAEEFLELGGTRRRDGFLFRVAHQYHAQQFVRAIALQPTTPISLMGPGEGVLSFGSLATFGLAGRDPSPEEFYALYRNSSEELMRSAVHSAFQAIDDFKTIKNSQYASFVNSFPKNQIAHRLADIAWLIRNRPEIPLYATEMRQWDTHASQGVTSGLFSELVGQLSSAIFALSQGLGRDWERTTVVAVTEFGRTAAENESGGTDHGHGSLAFVAGGRVRGGRIFGSWRELKKENLFEERDLPITTDSRSFLAEILREHLGIDKLGTIFPDFEYDPRRRLGLLS